MLYDYLAIVFLYHAVNVELKIQIKYITRNMRFDYDCANHSKNY